MEIIDYNIRDDESVSSSEENYKKYESEFTMKDYLNCKNTRKILEIEHLERFFKTAEKDINDFYDQVKKSYNGNGASILRFDTSCKTKAAILGLVYKYIHKSYDLSIFEKNPELAASLIAEYKEKNNTKLVYEE
tara:strand:- start:137 stop:538 length:402 start_codon:yes stop_codon:yes gene_type:complete